MAWGNLSGQISYLACSPIVFPPFKLTCNISAYILGDYNILLETMDLVQPRLLHLSTDPLPPAQDDSLGKFELDYNMLCQGLNEEIDVFVDDYFLEDFAESDEGMIVPIAQIHVSNLHSYSLRNYPHNLHSTD